MARYLAGLFLLVAAAGLVYGLWPHEAQRPVTEEPGYRLTWQDCSFRMPEDFRADCATLRTPDDDGAFALPVVVLRYEGEDRRPQPLLYLQGGPGASAGIDSEQGLWSWYHFREFAGLKRDLVLMDRRGTGASRPRFVCRDYERQGRQIMGQAVTAEAENRAALETLEHCLQHELVGFDPARFGTRASARDVRALMALLQPDTQWHLLGVSYGTRLA
ncbi:MAG TPA: alpha/beta fold hydrolase, partial [Marinobacter sp.]|nr:alpha/beta fold hydrolase [Marinobacter sp.]